MRPKINESACWNFIDKKHEHRLVKNQWTCKIPNEPTTWSMRSAIFDLSLILYFNVINYFCWHLIRVGNFSNLIFWVFLCLVIFRPNLNKILVKDAQFKWIRLIKWMLLGLRLNFWLRIKSKAPSCIHKNKITANHKS